MLPMPDAAEEVTRVVGASPDDVNAGSIAPHITASLSTYVLAIYGVNETEEELWRNKKPIPLNVTPVVYFIDRSGSIARHKKELQTVAAAFLCNTDAEGNVHVPKIQGGTALVRAIHEVQRKTGECTKCDVVIFTDGCENQFYGDLPVGVDEDGKPVIVTLERGQCNTDEYIRTVASHLSYICGCKLYFLGIGADAARMTGHMIRRRNCYVAHVPNNATVAQTMGIVQALRSEPLRLVEQDTHTGSDVADVVQQEVLRLHVSPEVEAAIQGLQASSVAAVASSAEQIQVTANAPPPPWTSERLKAMIEQAEKEAIEKIPRETFAKSRTALLFGLEAMCTMPLPGAMLGGKLCAMIEGDGTPTWGKFLNKMLSLLSQSNSGVLTANGKTPDAGAELEVFDTKVKFPKQCVLYKCTVPVTAVKELAEDEEWCQKQSSLKRKRC